MMVVMVVWLALGLFGVVRAVLSVVCKAFSSDKSYCDHSHRYSYYSFSYIFLRSQMLHYLHKI